MTLRVSVTWPNAHHALLEDSGAEVSIDADGAPVTVLVSGAGKRVFEIPDGTSTLLLRASFNPQMKAVGEVAAWRPKVFEVTQPFAIIANGTVAAPHVLPEYGGPHPLIDVVSAANKHAAVSIRLRTTFVDVTSCWAAYSPSHAAYIDRRTGTASGTELFALGFTGGAPLLWFASVPPGCRVPPTNAIGTVVFFRPATKKGYSRIDQMHNSFELHRYLLSPMPGEPAPPASMCSRRQWSRRKKGGQKRSTFSGCIAASSRPWRAVARRSCSFSHGQTCRTWARPLARSFPALWTMRCGYSGPSRRSA